MRGCFFPGIGGLWRGGLALLCDRLRMELVRGWVRSVPAAVGCRAPVRSEGGLLQSPRDVDCGMGSRRAAGGVPVLWRSG